MNKEEEGFFGLHQWKDPMDEIHIPWVNWWRESRIWVMELEILALSLTWA